MGVWRITVVNKELLSSMLGGRTRSNLRRSRHPIYVEAALSQAARQQRRAKQQLRNERIRLSKRTK